MPRIYTVGETVYDIMFEKDQPVAARAGGAMLNSAVSLGRSGHQVDVITEIGDDTVGGYVLNFLEENNVGTQFINVYPQAKTLVSLAFLNEKGAADYSFYKKYPKERLVKELPEPGKGDIVLFGSFYSLNKKIRPKLIGFIRKARENGALIVYDPNMRKNHLQDLGEVFYFVMENIACADLVRGSDEDFLNLFNSQEGEKVYAQVAELGCPFLIVTRSDQGAELHSKKFRMEVAAEKIEVVSTIGAGDSFNAGIIHGLVNVLTSDWKLESLGKRAWKEVMVYGTAFAADACSGFDNYISMDFVRKFGVS